MLRRLSPLVVLLLAYSVLPAAEPPNARKPKDDAALKYWLRKTDAGGYESALDARLKVDGSSWLAVRCYEERPDGRGRFAHTAPWHVEVDGKPLRPRKAEVEYLVKRVEEQLKRSAGVLPEAALAEYREGLRTYKELVKTAR